MKILDRHIALHVLGFSAVVGLALMALQSFVTLATEADDIGGNFGFFELVLVVVMQTPAILLVLLRVGRAGSALGVCRKIWRGGWGCLTLRLRSGWVRAE